MRNQLRFWRHKLGFTEQELTQKAGVSIATIVLIEKYDHYPGKDVRSRLSEALGVGEELIWGASEVNHEK
jgi:transcriptional regulator with XRE-family HTH domain